MAILSIGDELLCGEVVDTNAAFIGAELYRLGLKVERHLTVGDVESDIIDAMEGLASGSDAVIVTGGLGPTVDDITATVAARAAGRPLMLNQEALAHVGRMAGKLGGAIHPRNEKQALLPLGAELIPNPVGTACGFHLIHRGASFSFLPGVPVEMERMLRETVLPHLVARHPEMACLATKVLKIFGLSEAEVDARLALCAPPEVAIAFGVDFPEIHLKLRAEGQDQTAVADSLVTVAGYVRQQLGEFVLGEDDDTIDSVVAAGLRRTGLTLSVAESCTGGLMAKRVTDLPGSSDYFLEGAVTYTDTAKMRVLGVPRETIAAHGAVSAETARAMASGSRKGSGSDLALAITGIAGPGGGSAAKPVGTVFIAMATSGGCEAQEYHFSGSRDEIRTITAFTALDWLRRYLDACLSRI